MTKWDWLNLAQENIDIAISEMHKGTFFKNDIKIKLENSKRFIEEAKEIMKNEKG